jgi:hypothetical protein
MSLMDQKPALPRRSIAVRFRPNERISAAIIVGLVRALALFGRRLPERVAMSSLPASENLHNYLHNC